MILAKIRLILLIVVWLIALPTNVQADDDASYANFDSLVSELKASASDSTPTISSEDEFDWEEVAIHGGLGLATSYVSLTTPNGAAGAGLLKGLLFNFGINLFTRKIRAEGAFGNYGETELDSRLKADLQEFELRLVFMPLLQDNMRMRFGTGVAARYMNVEAHASGQWANYQTSTPTSLILVGLERKISKSVALGPDISYRSAMVADTFDKSAWDASFRLNATF